MGEIAEMMLAGVLCEQCGEFIGDEVGYPRNCGCDPSMYREQAPARKPFPCSYCKKRFSTVLGRTMHIRDKHMPKETVDG